MLESLVLERLGDFATVMTPAQTDLSAPHILHMIFSDENGIGLDGEMLVLGMDLAGVFVSTGSACSSGTVEPSHVFDALSIDRDVARGAVRFSLSSELSEDAVLRAAERISIVVNRVGGNHN